MTSMKTANIDLAAPQNEKNEKRDSIDDTSDILADVYRDTETGEISEAAVIAEGEERTTWFIWLLVSATAISGLLFGYDTGVISGALVNIKPSEFGRETLTNGQKEIITSSTALGALLGGLLAGMLSDLIGRRIVLGIADVIFIGGAVAQASCHTVWAMIGGRFLIGWGVGIAACIAPLYIQELSPTRLRGRMVVINVVMITLGQVIAYGIGAGFDKLHGGWRWMTGLGAVPAGIQIFLLFFLPESPRILTLRGKDEEVVAVMRKIYAHASEEQVQLKAKVLQAAVRRSREITHSTSFIKRFMTAFTNKHHRAALIISCGMQAFQQLCGFNTLMYFSATLFKSIGFDQPVAVGLIISGTNFVFTLVALKWIDQVGRRKIMIFSSPGMIIGLTLASISFYYMTRKTGGDLIDGTDYSDAWSAVTLVAMVFYVASYATGLGNVPWQQGELFSLEVRGIGTSLATATNWSMNLLINSTYLSLMDRITPAGAFGFYAGLCLLGWVFVLFCFPETAGLSLEEVKLIFNHGFGIKESQRLRASKKAIRERGNKRFEEGA